MRALFRVAILAAALVLAATPGSALALKLVPPGNSAADQYTETLPGTQGGVPTDEIGRGESPAKVLGSSNAARLEALGEEGRAAAELAAATAPGRAGVGEATAAPGSSSGLSEVLGQVTGTSGSGGMGMLLPLAIALALAGSLAFAVGRRRAAQGRG